MNINMVRYVLGKLMLVEAILMVPSLIVGLIYRESMQTIGAFLLSMAILLAAGWLCSLKKPADMLMYAREGFVIVALGWFILSFFGSLPYIFSGSIHSFIDAYFETASGFTTTGSSIIRNIETFPHSILFWRSFTHLIGGMGVLVFVLAILPKVGYEGVYMMKAEIPGPVFGKLVSKVRDSARVLYLIYFVMTAILILLLVAGGMPVFDSFLHSFGAAGTGGFGIKSNSIAFYDSTYIDYVLGIAMILFGVNFNLYYLLLLRQFRAALSSEELRWYLGFITAAILLICFNVAPQYDSISRLIRDVFFTVSSIITTTGYSTVDFDKWPLFSHSILLLLMFCGAMAGSTGGGLKVSRIAISFKAMIRELNQAISPNRYVAIRYEKKPLDRKTEHSAIRYLAAYVILFSVLLLICSINAPNFVSAFSSVAATLNNIGPGLDVVGPTMNYADLSNLSKIALSIGMIAGRLEIFPVLILFSPRTWRKI